MNFTLHTDGDREVVLFFRVCKFKAELICVSVRHTFRLVLDRGWLRLLNFHGSEGVSIGSLWSSGVIPSVPGSWNIPMEMGRSFLDSNK